MEQYKKLKVEWNPELDQDMVAVTSWKQSETSLDERINACKLSIMIYESDDSTPSVRLYYMMRLNRLIKEKIILDHCEG